MRALESLKHFGQAYWQDDLSRGMIESGALEQRIIEKGLAGVTTNPTIFRNAILQADDYDAAIRSGAARGDSAEEIYRSLVIADVQRACDLFLPLHQQTEGRDGQVSLEVSPLLAHDTEATCAEARALWRDTDRLNLLIKVPGTPAGLAAVEQLIFEGIGVNITLLFSREDHAAAFETYLKALERRAEAGRALHSVTSVASLFLSRIDAAADALLQQQINDAVRPAVRERAEACLGRAAVASAKVIYACFSAELVSPRWQALQQQGAQIQRIVWASTGVKDPAYRDVRYVEPLIGPHTATTLPPSTAAAFDEHGVAAASAALQAQAAAEDLTRLREAGVDLETLCRQLVNEGVQKFVDPYLEVLSAIQRKADLARRADTARQIRGEADRLRGLVLRMTTEAGSGHPSSCLSSAELMSALMFHAMRWDPQHPEARDVDQLVLSKGHAAPLLWAALHEAGALEEDPLSLRQIDSSLEGHPTPRNPWVRVATGSLGQGLAAANGMALANRLDGIPAWVYCLLGDGECSEGSVWESAQFAVRHGLDRVVALVDANGLQQSAPTPFNSEHATALARRFEAFGWQALEVNGHAPEEILEAIDSAHSGGPTVIVAHTRKGRGVALMEGAEGWHGKPLTAQQRDQALEALNPGAPPQVQAQRLGVSGSPAQVRVEPLRPDYRLGEQAATREAFGRALTALGKMLPDLVVLDADVQNSTKTQAFGEQYPDRFFQADIAEQAMIGAALGLAVSGKRACAATFAAFLTRAYDFLRMAAYSQPPHLLICGSHAGVSIGEDGPSQMGLEDIAMMRALPNTCILCPADAVSAEHLTAAALDYPGLVYLRTNRGKTPVLYAPEEAFAVGGSKTLRASAEDRVTLVASGVTVHTALAAHESLLAAGVPTRVIDAYSIKPLDVAALQRAMRETGILLVVEDHSIAGGLSEAVSHQVGRLGRVFGLGVAIEPRSGPPEAQQERHRISTRAVEQEVKALAA